MGDLEWYFKTKPPRPKETSTCDSYRYNAFFEKKPGLLGFRDGTYTLMMPFQFQRWMIHLTYREIKWFLSEGRPYDYNGQVFPF